LTAVFDHACREPFGTRWRKVKISLFGYAVGYYLNGHAIHSHHSPHMKGSQPSRNERGWLGFQV
jgi:hypothetical protein